MKKNLIFGMLAAAGLLLAASCSQEQLTPTQDGDEVTVSFAIGLESGVQTRAISDGTTADQLTYALYDGTGNLVTSFGADADDTEDLDSVEGQKTIKTTFPTTVTLSLAKGQTYKVAFWAQSSECEAYTVEAAETAMNVSVSYDDAVNNDETRDAFYAVTGPFTVTGSTAKDVELTRPFAQINVGVTKADWNGAVASGITIDSSKVVITNAATSIDLLTGTVSGSDDAVVVTYAADLIPSSDQVLKTDADGDGTAEEYVWLSMSYILVNDQTAGGAEKTTLESLAYTFTTEDYDIITFSDGLTSVPVQRNYRTNIVGQILTGNIDFNIVIDPAYIEPDEIIDEWDGSSSEVTATDGVYYVSNASELAWIAEQVNEGNSNPATTTKAGNFFQNMKIVLTDDIYLNNQPWTPIGTLPAGQNVKQNQDSYGTYGFQGTFDGAGHTIYDLNANSNNATGLFGAVYGTVEIKDVTIDGATITSNRYAGVIAGYFNAASSHSLKISNCAVKNASVNVSVEYTTKDDGSEGYDNGDKAGGIIGYATSVTIDGCSVANTSITAYRDMGGIIGNALGSSSSVSNCSVSGITFIVDATQNYNSISTSSIDNFNVGDIIGRNNSDQVTSDNNTSENVTSGEILVADGVTCDATTGVYSISTAAGMFWFADQVNVSKKTFSGETVQLAADIDLESAVWEPVGQTGNMTFYGTFDGNGKTISNLYVEAQAIAEAEQYYSSGLFGWIENHNSTGVVIKDLTVSGANINGHHYVGTIAGYLYGVTIQNCTVTGATVTGTHATDEACGDKVGGIGGYDAGKNTVSITGCTVKDSAIYAARDAGQILGAGHSGVSVTEEGDDACTVENVTVQVNGVDEGTCDSYGNNINADPIGRKLS